MEINDLPDALIINTQALETGQVIYDGRYPIIFCQVHCGKSNSCQKEIIEIKYRAEAFFIEVILEYEDLLQALIY